MIKLNKGTKENIVVDVTDVLSNLVTLDDADVHFDVYSDDDNLEHVVDNVSASNDNMEAFCLIDTTPDEFTPRVYNLYLKLTAMPEVPILGPVKFRIDPL